MTERRESTRVPVNEQFRTMDGAIGRYATDVSRTGAFIRTDERLPVGSRVRLELTLVVDDIERLLVQGHVVRLSDDPPGMGIRFSDLPLESEAIIDRLVADHEFASGPITQELRIPAELQAMAEGE